MRRKHYVLLVGGFMILAMLACGTYQTKLFQESVAGASAATIVLEPSSDQDITIRSLGSSDQLFEANADYENDMDFKITGAENRTVKLVEADGSMALNLGGKSDDMEWAVKLNPRVPLTVEIDMAAGDLDADLRELNLAGLIVHFDAGDADIQLPARDDPIDVAFDFSVGDAAIDIPGGDTLHFTDRIDMGSGDVTVTVGEGVVLEADVDMGRGTLVLVVPDDAAVRLVIERAGLGTVRVPEDYANTVGEDGTAVWESPGYARVERSITLSVAMDRGDLIVR